MRQRNSTELRVPLEAVEKLIAEAENTTDDEAPMLWTDEEQLLTSRGLARLGATGAEPQLRAEGLRGLLRVLAMCGVLASFGSMIIGPCLAARRSEESPFEKSFSRTSELARFGFAAGRSHLI